MDMRPIVILERAFICYVASAMLGYILVSIIGGCANQAFKKSLSRMEESLSSPAFDAEETKSPAPAEEEETEASPVAEGN